MNPKFPAKTVAILGSQRLPFMKIGTDLAKRDILDLLTRNLEGLVNKYGLSGQVLGEVTLGATFFHPAYWNVSRDAVLRAGLSPHTPAIGIQRACATSLEAAIHIANKVALG